MDNHFTLAVQFRRTPGHPASILDKFRKNLKLWISETPPSPFTMDGPRLKLYCSTVPCRGSSQILLDSRVLMRGHMPLATYATPPAASDANTDCTPAGFPADDIMTDTTHPSTGRLRSSTDGRKQAKGRFRPSGTFESLFGMAGEQS